MQKSLSGLDWLRCLVTFTGDITLNAQSDVRFADSDSSNYVALQAPATVSSNGRQHQFADERQIRR